MSNKDNKVVDFGVRVTKKTEAGSSVLIEVWHTRPGARPQDFAKIDASSLDLAMRMALPYFLSAAEGDLPFA